MRVPYALALVDSALSLIRPIVPVTVAVITLQLRDASARSPLDTIPYRRDTASVLWPVSIIATLRAAGRTIPERATHLNQLIRQLCLSQPSQIQEYQLQQVFSG